MNELLLISKTNFEGKNGRFLFGTKTQLDNIKLPLKVAYCSNHYTIDKSNTWSIFLRKPSENTLLFYSSDRGIRVIDLSKYPEWNEVFVKLARKIHFPVN